MNNFGVIEVASTKTTHAPGWAYVPDTPASSIPSQSVSAVHLHVNRNKRAARAANNSSSGYHNGASAVNERHDAKLQKEIDQLQRDHPALGGAGGGARGDAHIPIPSGGRDKDGKIRGHTANVRKILASQKTFANHLDDFEAWSRTQQGPGGGGGGGEGGGSAGPSASGTPAPPGGAAGGGAGAGAASGGGGGGAPGKKGGNNTSSAGQKKAGASSGSSRAAKADKTNHKSATPAPDADVTMTDAPPTATTTTTTTTTGEEKNKDEKKTPHHPQSSGSNNNTNNNPFAAAEPPSQILTPFTRFAAPSHPGDADPLLASWLPPLPTDEELRELMRAPPLTYHQARGVWAPAGAGDAGGAGEGNRKRYPTRHFCEVCGYWGRVRCMKCGTRVCALDCLNVHREECITRYGL